MPGGRPVGSKDKVPRKRLSVEERLWAKIDRRGPDECWPWFASKDRWGYGQLRCQVDGSWTYRKSHVLAWETVNGPMPAGLSGLHSCNSPSCCNPAHVRPGAHLENMQDRKRSGNYAVGSSHPMSKLSSVQRSYLHAAIKQGDRSYDELSRVFDVSASQVYCEARSIGHARKRGPKWR